MARRLLYALLLAAVRLIPLRFQHWVALRSADADYGLLNRGRAAVIRANQRQADPGGSPARIDAHARWALRNFAKHLTEFFRFRHMDRAYLERRVTLAGRERLDVARAGGNGAVLVSMHLSNWELAGAALSAVCGYPVSAIAEPHPQPAIDRLFTRERRALGVGVIPTGAGSARQALRVLRGNGFLCILGDRDPAGTGVQVDFFGRPCRFPQGPARLALAAGAPLLPGFCRRRGSEGFVIGIQAPIPPPPRGPEGVPGQVREMTQAFARRCEEAVRRQPDEWTAFYPLWDGEWRAR